MDPMTRSAVARITPSGQITEITDGVNPTGLTDGDSVLAGSNGALWFTDSGSPDAIGRIVISPIAATGSAIVVSSTAATVSGSVTPFADTTWFRSNTARVRRWLLPRRDRFRRPRRRGR